MPNAFLILPSVPVSGPLKPPPHPKEEGAESPRTTEKGERFKWDTLGFHHLE